MASDESVCPVCKQPVDMVVRRHKTLGVFVPVWGSGPCRNPRCASYEEGEESGRPEVKPTSAASEAGPAPMAERRRPKEPRATMERDS
jgi:hypothetical protein